MSRYALIGYPLGHSFSQSYFIAKFQNNKLDSSYVNIEIKTLSGLRQIIEGQGIKGFNVTTPHKQNIIEFLDEISPEAAAIGAVNCVDIRNGKWIGHNTDVHGFANSLKSWIGFNAQQALILGDGGASKAVQYALTHLLNVSFTVVSRSGSVTYAQLTAADIGDAQLLVQCTTLGMQPNTNQSPPMDYAAIGSHHWCYDLVYNPSETTFMRQCAAQGANVKNGLEMLHLQAEASYAIWNGQSAH